MKQIVAKDHLGIIYITAFLIRALVMLFLIQPYSFYKQSDSNDYHNCALMLATGHGMFRADTHEPLFWRTPGYPAYLSLLYRYMGVTHAQFEENRTAQLIAIWLQIIFASFIPIILFYLAYLLTRNNSIAIIVAWISVLHPGLILASTYLLTEGLALIFFYLFLLFFFEIVLLKNKSWVTSLFAALTLSLYTWMRPMGEFIALFSIVLLAFRNIKQALLFGLIFFASIAPWYIRNHALTNEWFFCPTIGTYLTCFSVPKILRRTLNKPIEECLAIAQNQAGREVQKKKMLLFGTGKYVSNNACKDAAYPVIMQYPHYFIYDWFTEVIKTTFDLYSYQLIPMINGSYWYDPIEEYLPTKVADCLYTHPMPWHGRIICWLEFLSSILVWIGVIAGSLLFLFFPLFKRNKIKENQIVWFYSLLMIGLIVGMTGGFGYARLRLPAEPLILILALSFWISWYKKETIRTHKAIS